MQVEARLEELGLVLPEPLKALFLFLQANRFRQRKGWDFS
jgi:hypothetical protein